MSGALDLRAFVVGNSIDTTRRRAKSSNARPASMKSRAGSIFADDHLLRRDPLPETLRKLGVILKPLERGVDRARRTCSENISWPSRPRSAPRSSPRSMKLSSDRAPSFTCRAAWKWNCRSRFSIGCTRENASVFPHTLLIADELSKVTVIEHFRSARSRRGPASPAASTTWWSGAGAKVKYICAQNWNDKRAVHPDQRHHGRARRLRVESERASRRRIFALRKPEPPHRRRRAQRSARRLRRRQARRNSMRALCRITLRRTPRAICSTRTR